MKAALVHSYGEPLDVVTIGEAEPPVVGPDYVLIDVEAAGVNPVDWKSVAGYLQGRFPHHLPVIPGWDVAGTVAAVGPAVTEFTEGDRVAAYARKDHVQLGTFAEQVAVHVRGVALVPDPVDLESAGALPLAALTAEQLLDAADVRTRDVVLVHAASGGVGSFAVQLAVKRGASVVGTASEPNHDYLRDLGATPIAYGDGLADRLREVAPDGVDVVIDLVGGDTLAASPALLATRGRIGSIVDPGGVKELGGRYVFVRPDADMLARLLGYVAEGSLRVHVSERYGLDDAARALEASRRGHTRGKIVVTVP